MSATALLTKTPQPSDAQIEQGMAGNICRCATYARIKSAIRQAAGLTAALAEAPAPKQVLADAATDHQA
ncbi:MAG: 2Fe-2S iron-sulfur cluster-binding protein, partial [Caulobacteraceae bacterium]